MVPADVLTQLRRAARGAGERIGTKAALPRFPETPKTTGTHGAMPIRRPNEPTIPDPDVVRPPEPIELPKPDVIRPPTPEETPERDIPTGVPDQAPDLPPPAPPQEIPRDRPPEIPPSGRGQGD